jgi:integrase
MDDGRTLRETAKVAVELSRAYRSKSASTRRAYASDWRHFEGWCQENGLNPLPAKPSSIARYIDYLMSPGDGAKPSKAATISRRLTSINAAHRLARLVRPALKSEPQLTEPMQELQQTIAAQSQTQKKPLTPALIAQILATPDGPIAAARNRALLLIGVAGSLGNSDLAAIQVEDLIWHEEGITIKPSRSIGATPRRIEIPFAVGDQPCPVKALESWLTIARLEGGRVFRSVGKFGTVGKGIHPNSISKLVKKFIRMADISSPRSYGGLSIRRGYATESPESALERELAKLDRRPSKDADRRRALIDQVDKYAAVESLGL